MNSSFTHFQPTILRPHRRRSAGAKHEQVVRPGIGQYKLLPHRTEAVTLVKHARRGAPVTPYDRDSFGRGARDAMLQKLPAHPATLSRADGRHAAQAPRAGFLSIGTRLR